jgi:thioredoxin 1
MIARRSVLMAALAAVAANSTAALAKDPERFDAAGFATAQKLGKPIVLAVHASWCSTCKTQKAILAELTADQRFKDLMYFAINFDSQKDALRRFGVRMQSTLIVFNGSVEQGRSAGDVNRRSIEALLSKIV